MSIFTKLGNDIVAGTDASGASRQVVNSEMQVWLTEVERIIDSAVSAGNFKLYATKALLDADLAPAANTAALVLGENAANDGIYGKSGGTGIGSWVLAAEPPSSGFLQATDAAGTANAIAVTTTATANESHLFVVPIVITNTATPVTISFNGDTAKTIKGLDGLDVSVGELIAGSSIFGFISGTEFKWTIAANGATGPQGIQGIQGVKGNSTGLAYTFSTSITAADPGAGVLSFNDPTLANVTEIYINDADADGGDPSAYIDTWDDSTSTVKSRLLIRSMDDVSKLGIFNVALVVNSTGYRTLTVAYVGGTAALIASENLVLESTGSKGDKGDTGAAGSGLANIVDDVTPQLGGPLDANGNTIDLGGNELILDLNADTSITADTDDTIDIKIAGADDFQFTANKFNALTGSTIETADAGAVKENSISITPIGQQTIWIPALAMEPRVTTAPATSNVVEIATSLIALRTMDFATAANEYAGFAIKMPKSWDKGTLIAQFDWSTDGTQTAGLDGVRWFIRAGAYASNDVLTTALGTAVGATAQNHSGTANDIMITAETTAITVAGAPTAEEWLYFEVYRDTADAGDDLDIDARLHGVKIHYTINAGNDN